MEFETEIEIEHDGGTGKAKLKWFFEIERRSWGVKSIFPIVPYQEIEVCIKYLSEDGRPTWADHTLKLENVKLDLNKNSEILCPVSLRNDDGTWVCEFDSF